MCRILVLLAIGLPALAAGDDVHCDAQLDAPDEVDLLQRRREERSLRVGQGRGDCPPVPPQCEGINSDLCVYLDPQCLQESLEGCYAGGTSPECRYCDTQGTPQCPDVATASTSSTTTSTTTSTSTSPTSSTTAAATTTMTTLNFVQMVEQEGGKCLDFDPNAATANADAAACTGEDSQLWALNDDQELIVKVGSLCLTGTVAAGGTYYNAVLEECHGSDAQKFKLAEPDCDPTHHSGCQFVNVAHKGFCLDNTEVPGEESNVALYMCDAGPNQRWQFVPPR